CVCSGEEMQDPFRGCSAQRALEIVQVALRELRAEMRNSLEHVERAEILACTRGVNETGRLEAELLEEHERQPPRAPRDQLPAAATASARGRRALRAAQARQSVMLDSAARDALELRRILGRGGGERLEQRLGPLVGRAEEVKP